MAWSECTTGLASDRLYGLQEGTTVPITLSRLAFGVCVALFAACGGNIGPTTQTPTPAPTPTPSGRTITTVSISGAPGSATVGDQFPLKAMAAYSDNTSADVTGQATWASSNTVVATVTAGQLSLTAAGEVDILVTFSGTTA